MAIGFWRRLLYTLILDIAGLSSAIFATINAVFLFRISLTAHVARTVGMSVGKIMDNYYQLIGYLEFPWVHKLRLSDFSFSEHGLTHMAEVKNLFMVNMIVMVVSIFAAICLYRYIAKNQKWWELVGGLQNSMILVPIVIVFVSIDFDHWFILFHQAFFNNNYWIFDPSIDPIINVLPDSFFTSCFIFMFGLFELYLLISFWVAKKQVN
jgi:integral membrane protein (TIGR01906 family)